MTITENETPEIDPGVDRRKMLRNVTIAAAAAAVGGAALSGQKAGADDLQPVVVGGAYTPDTPTTFTPDADYDATTDNAGVLHVGNAAATDPTIQEAAFSAVVDAAGDGALDVGFYGQAVSATGRGAVLDAQVPLQLADTVSTTPPDLTVGTAGQFRVVDGSLWYCAQTDTGTDDAVWIQLASASSAGNLIAIDPIRVYDSRQAIPGDGPISRSGSRTISVADARNANGSIATADAVPAGAKAIAFNITLTETTSTFGYLSLVPGDFVGTPTSSTINWDAPDRTIANGGVVRIAADRTIKVFCSDPATPAGSTEFAIDVTGYYL